MHAPELVVIGTPSLDRIDIRGETLDTVGGSGFITALAARVCGVRAGVVARVPRILPDPIEKAFVPGGLDPGGLIPVDGPGPGFHISYDADEVATYVEIIRGDEAALSAADVPRRWLDAAWVHIGPLAASAHRQLTFVDALRARGYRGRISAATFGWAAEREAETVRELFDRVDVAFMNRAELEQVYGAQDALPSTTTVCVTAGRDGVRVWNGDGWTRHEVTPAQAFDPTGAGDSFAGGYLAGVILDDAEPAVRAIATAAVTISGPGAAPLIDRLVPDVSVDVDSVVPRAHVASADPDRIATVARLLAREANEATLTFTGGPFPEVGAPYAVEMLCVATLHQYGFWTGTDAGYGGPMWATIDGVRRKGSDFLWHAFTRAVANDPTVVDPRRLASEPLLFDQVCRADDGECPIPDAGSHRALQQAYGVAIEERGGVRALLDRANTSSEPLGTFLSALSEVPGYGEDPLEKKSNLLALILSRRPERFLELSQGSGVAPIVDYHIMRTMLRTGCVRIDDPKALETLVARGWISEADEAAIRVGAHDAIEALCAAAELTVGQVDGFLFSLGRRVCTEVEPPDCARCPADGVCAHRTDLFQPILRTTYY